MRRLWWWIVDYSYALYGHLLVVGGRRRRARLRAGSQRAILLVPGIVEGWYFMLPLAGRLSRRGHNVHILPLRARDAQTVVEVASMIHTYIEAHDLTDVTLVGHSKGGLDGLAYLARYSGDERVQRLIAVSAPFNGTIFAYHVKHPLVRQFLPEGQEVQAVASIAVDEARVLSIAPAWDNHVWHPLGSYLKGATNLELPVYGHHRIVFTEALADTIEVHIEGR